jgi:HSP20 family protein
MAKRRRFPFMFGWDDNEFDRMRDEMEDMVERMMEGFEEMNPKELEKRSREGKSFVRGYSITIGPDGKPAIREFGDKPQMVDKGMKISDEREPLVDVIEEKDNVKIIVELPGVSRDNINLKSTDGKLEIKVDAAGRRYHKVIELPCEVKPLSAKANYKNGVLEVTLDRKEPKKEEKGGFKVKID